MSRLFLCIFPIVLYTCTYSPRYNSNSGQNPSNVTTNINKNHKKTYTGISSWYGPNFHGKLTANGEVYDQWGITAAHKTLPFNTIVKVINLDNKKTLILRINDRGPYVGNRILDCSYGAAKKLGFADQGTANIRIEVIEFGDGEYMHHER